VAHDLEFDPDGDEWLGQVRYGIASARSKEIKASERRFTQHSNIPGLAQPSRGLPNKRARCVELSWTCSTKSVWRRHTCRSHALWRHPAAETQHLLD
jgi:hypothetical protein